MATATLLTTEARFKCDAHRVRYFLVGRVETVYADLDSLIERHQDCER